MPATKASPAPGLPAPLAAEDAADLDALYRSWGIAGFLGESVAEMPAAWLQILNMARNLAAHKAIPGVDLPLSLADLVREQEQRYSTVTRVVKHSRASVIPPGPDTVIQPIRAMADLPNVPSSELMVRDLSRELFEFRLMNGEIGALYAQEARTGLEEYEETVQEQVPISVPPSARRQKVYVLLDVSNSMREHNKILLAKALLLAYLVRAHQEGSRIYCRTFGNSVHPLTSATDAGAFPDLARRVLSVAPEGSTDIRGALVAAINDVRELDEMHNLRGLFEKPATEILLVSDCESYSVPVIPHNITLHTVHLKGGRMFKSFAEGFERIRAQSATFTEIDTTALQLPDTARDVELLARERARDVTAAARSAMTALPSSKAGLLLEAYQRMDGSAPRTATISLRTHLFRMGGRLGLAQTLRLLWEAARKLRPHRRRRDDLEHPARAAHAGGHRATGLAIRKRH